MNIRIIKPMASWRRGVVHKYRINISVRRSHLRQTWDEIVSESLPEEHRRLAHIHPICEVYQDCNQTAEGPIPLAVLVEEPRPIKRLR